MKRSTTRQGIKLKKEETINNNSKRRRRERRSSSEWMAEKGKGLSGRGKEIWSAVRGEDRAEC